MVEQCMRFRRAAHPRCRLPVILHQQTENISKAFETFGYSYFKPLFSSFPFVRVLTGQLSEIRFLYLTFWIFSHRSE